MTPEPLGVWDVFLRMLCSMAVGTVIGTEREYSNRPAGMRTHILVALGACAVMLTGQMIFTQYSSYGAAPDPARLAAQVITGVGFLGAGTIIVTGRQEVKGLTTAAGLWASACMGIAIGAGFYECMIVGTLLIVFSMKLLPMIENVITRHARNMSIYVSMDSIENLGGVVGYMKTSDIQLYDVEIDKANEHLTHINALFSIHLPKRLQHTEVLAKIATMDGIIAIEEI